MIHDIRIIFLSGQFIGASIPVSLQKELVFGRNPLVCQVVISGFQIGRIHCSVRYDLSKNAIVLTNYSQNGTYIKHLELNRSDMHGQNDGQKRYLIRQILLAIPNEFYYLASGDVIQLGDTDNIFQIFFDGDTHTEDTSILENGRIGDTENLFLENDSWNEYSDTGILAEKQDIYNVENSQKQQNISLILALIVFGTFIGILIIFAIVFVIR